MLEVILTDFTKIKDIPIMPDRFNSITELTNYPIVHTSLTSITELKYYN